MRNASQDSPNWRLAEHNLLATYPDAEHARAALLRLERRGVEAADIEVLGPGSDPGGSAIPVPVTNDEQRTIDMNFTGAVARRGGLGLAAGAALGALVAGVAAAVVAGGAAPVVGSVVAGMMAGAALGFLYASYSGLPVNEQFEDTFDEVPGATTVAVHSADPHEIDVALDALRDTQAIGLAVCGRDGTLRLVA
jgi:hypothetical protein